MLTYSNTIKSGENLSTIAQNAGLTPAAFAALNPHLAGTGANSYQGLLNNVSVGQGYNLSAPVAPVATPTTAPITTSTGVNTTSAGTGSVISTSAPIIAQEKNTINDVNSIYNNDAYTQGHNDYLTTVNDQYNALETRRKNEIDSINAQFDQKNNELQQNQKGETGTFTSTLARIGGYLGDSVSSAGSMINLNRQHVLQLNDLESRRQSALQDAKTAIDDKQFALAQAKANEAKTYAKEIQDSKQQFFENSIKTLQEERAASQTERTNNQEDLSAILEFSKGQTFDELTPEAQQKIIYATAHSSALNLDMVKNALSTNKTSYNQANTKAELENRKTLSEIYKNNNSAAESGYTPLNLTGGESDAVLGQVARGILASNGVTTIQKKALTELIQTDGLQGIFSWAYSNKLSQKQKSDYDLFDQSISALDEAIYTAGADDLASGPYKDLLEKAKPWATIVKDQKYSSLKSKIELAQTQVRKGYYGTAVTKEESGTANNFLVDTSKDDLETMMTKMVGLRNFLKFSNDVTIAKAVGAPRPDPAGYGIQVKGSAKPTDANSGTTSSGFKYTVEQ